jgi:hypothetical protein
MKEPAEAKQDCTSAFLPGLTGNPVSLWFSGAFFCKLFCEKPLSASASCWRTALRLAHIELWVVAP